MTNQVYYGIKFPVLPEYTKTVDKNISIPGDLQNIIKHEVFNPVRSTDFPLLPHFIDKITITPTSNYFDKERDIDVVLTALGYPFPIRDLIPTITRASFSCEPFSIGLIRNSIAFCSCLKILDKDSNSNLAELIRLTIDADLLVCPVYAGEDAMPDNYLEAPMKEQYDAAWKMIDEDTENLLKIGFYDANNSCIGKLDTYGVTMCGDNKFIYAFVDYNKSLADNLPDDINDADANAVFNYVLRK